MTLRGRSVLVLGAAALGLTACATILGIEDGIPDNAEGGADGGDASADVATDAPACTPDASEKPDDGAGIFVAAAPVGEDRTGCGTRQTPCATIGNAIALATSVTGKSIIYVAHGAYHEAVSLAPGLTIDGGWEIIGQDWLRNCTATPEDAVHIVAPDDRNVTLLAEYDGGARVRLVTLGSKDGGASAGESLFGVFARGAGTSLVLEGVTMSVGAGGAGPDGVMGAAGDGGSGNCASADGGIGSTPIPGAGADAGAFDPTGFVPSSATASGSSGLQGLSGAPAPTPVCVDCFGCAAVCGAKSGTSCGTSGTSGCGGFGGHGGGPGHGGGSSVGVFAWNANVALQQCHVMTGAGGAGGRGGDGGAGGVGSMGDAGDLGPTCNICSNGVTCNNGTGPAGAPGGRGGAGGAGSVGGGGAAGWSIGIVQGGDAGLVTLDASDVKPGPAGVSRGNGAAGKSAERYP